MKLKTYLYLFKDLVYEFFILFLTYTVVILYNYVMY